jgi:hypothetical protein
MANLSSAAVATLVTDIADLRKALEGTLIDQAEVVKRYDAATNGLLTPNGSLDTAKWENLTPKQQGEVEARLSKLKQELLDLKEVYVDEDGPADEGSFMHRDYASNKAIICLTILAVIGLFGDLALICHEWEAATAGTRGILEFGTRSFSADTAKKDATGLTPTPATAAKDPSKLAPNQTPAPAQIAVLETSSPSPEGTASATFSPTVSAAKSPAAKSSSAASAAPSPANQSDQNKEDKKEAPGNVTEQAVLWMVILLGALGGFLYLASSMGTYVGNRQLLKSWILYYVLIPFQGAALAPLIYLLLRVGVLNPANPTSSGRPMASLNLMGIYAFAALTGLFSKQAIEMLADVFATIFKKVSAKDSLEKPKSDTEKREK